MTERAVKLLIIGSGAAGYTAAIYAARAMLQPVVLAGLEPGGQLTTTTDVENFPGFELPVQGPWLMEQMRAQAEHVGAEIVYDIASSVDLSARPFRVVTDGEQTYLAEALIVATGAQAKYLGLESETEFKGFGVSACATCDGFFYRGKNVAVIGGGNTAVEEALYLSTLAKSVTVIHRRDQFRAEHILQDRLLKRENVSILWNSQLHKIMGSDNPKSVTGVQVKHVESGELRDIAIDGVFIAIGHAPAVEFLKEQLELKPSGVIKTAAHSTETSVEGVFAAGDVMDDRFRQAVTAAGTGCMAALEAEKFLSE